VQTRRPLAILAATALAGSGLTALASPVIASANITVGQLDDDSYVVIPGSAIGTSVVLTNASDGPLGVVSQSLSDNNGECRGDRDPLCSVSGGFESATFDIAPGASGASVSLNRFLEQGLEEVATFTVTYPDAPAAGGPAPVIQQFEKPTTGTCDEAQPEGLNWGGAASGGWGESWAQWMHEGQGGAVCTRTLAYNNSTATWQAQ